jgi:hypothetical protein
VVFGGVAVAEVVVEDVLEDVVAEAVVEDCYGVLFCS